MSSGEEIIIDTDGQVTFTGESPVPVRIRCDYSTVNVTLDDVSINCTGSSRSPIEISDDSTTNLTITGTNTNTLVGGNDSHYPGIKLNNNCTLNISGDGQLNVSGSMNSAGICTGYYEDTNAVILNSGTVTVNGHNSTAILVDSFQINGGTLTSNGDSSYAIDVNTLTIQDGTVTAKGDDYNAIDADSLAINGGTVIADGGTSIGISSNNGSISNNSKVYVTSDFDGGNGIVGSVNISGLNSGGAIFSEGNTAFSVSSVGNNAFFADIADIETVRGNIGLPDSAPWNTAQGVYYQGFTVEYDSNNGTSQKHSAPYFNGESVTLPECTYTYQNYYCAGWNTNTTGNGTNYLEGSTTSAINTHTTLYVKWMPYKITSTSEKTYTIADFPDITQGSRIEIETEAPVTLEGNFDGIQIYINNSDTNLILKDYSSDCSGFDFTPIHIMGGYSTLTFEGYNEISAKQSAMEIYSTSQVTSYDPFFIQSVDGTANHTLKLTSSSALSGKGVVMMGYGRVAIKSGTIILDHNSADACGIWINGTIHGPGHLEIEHGRIYAKGVAGVKSGIHLSSQHGNSDPMDVTLDVGPLGADDAIIIGGYDNMTLEGGVVNLDSSLAKIVDSADISTLMSDTGLTVGEPPWSWTLATAYHQKKTVTLTAGSGGSVSPVGSTEVIYGADLLISATPNDSYKFVQWSDGDTERSRTLTDITSDTTLTATFELNEFTVTLNDNEGSGGSGSVTATYDEAMPTPINTPLRTGFTFNGYFDAQSGGTQYYTNTVTSAISYDKTSACTLYAQWTANDYTVTLDHQNGEADTTVTATYDSAMPSATKPTRTGYTFDGYYTGTGGSGTQYYNASMESVQDWDIANSTTTLYAKWTANTYTVTFDQNTKSGSSAVVGTTTSKGFTYDTEDTLTDNGYSRTGYTFKGWNAAHTWGDYTPDYTDEQSILNLSSTHNDSITLYAVWEPDTCTVTFNGNKGSGSSDIVGSTASVDIVFDESANLIANGFSRTGYDYVDWNSAANGSGTSYTDGVLFDMDATNYPNRNLFAQWSTKNYDVVFDGNGEDGGTMVNQSIDFDATAQLAANQFYKTNYVFNGWNTDDDGNGTDYAAGADYTMLVTGETLYAQWLWAVADVSEGETFDISTLPSGGVVRVWGDATLTGTNTNINVDCRSSVNLTIDDLNIDNSGISDRNCILFQGLSSSENSLTLVGTNTLIGSPNQPAIKVEKPTKLVISSSSGGSVDATGGSNGAGIGGSDRQDVGSITITSGTVIAQGGSSAAGIGGGDNGDGGDVVISGGTVFATGGTDGAGIGGGNGEDGGAVTITGGSVNALGGDNGDGIGGGNGGTGGTVDISEGTVVAKGGTGANDLANGGDTASVYVSGGDVTADGVYDVTFSNNGGIGASYTQSISDGNTAALSANAGRFTRTSYTYEGWNTQADEGGDSYADGADYTMGSSDVTLYVNWDAVTYDITYTNTFGATNTNPETYTIETVDINLAGLSRTGYTFDGWEDESNNSVTVIAQGSTGNVSLTATWTPVPYNITYENMTDATQSNPATYTIETDTITLSNAAKTGYSFDGWYSEAELTNLITEIAIGSTGDMTLYADWSLNEYDVIFNANGGDGGTVDNQSIIYQDTENLTTDVYTRTGYDFITWNTLSGGGGTDYAPGDEFTMSQAGDQTLYAIWMQDRII